MEDEEFAEAIIGDDNDIVYQEDELEAGDLEHQEQEENEYDEISGDDDAESRGSSFDKTLATLHSYLGNDLEILRGRTLLDSGIYTDLPLWLPQTDWNNEMILFPGQTLPIMERDMFSIGLLKKCIAKDRTFGVAAEININGIGTTAEIYEYFETEDGEIRIKAKGRQRFRILRLRNIPAGTMAVADVEILPEIVLSQPLFEYRLASLDRLRVTPVNEETAKQYRSLTRRESVLTPWPAWVHDQYNSRLLSLKIHENLKFLRSKGSNIPSDPIDLSFWVAQNIVTRSNDMMALLKQDCAITRLQMEVQLLTEMTNKTYACKTCKARIAKLIDVLPMNQEGLQSAYVNPTCIVFEIVTVSRVQNVRLDGIPSTIYSWFPGYAWIVAGCAICNSHVGWRFIATNNDLKPKSFWGLTLKSIE